MDRVRISAVVVFAAAVFGCGPGDHAKSAGVGNLFGGGAAGKSVPRRANEPDAEPDPNVDASDAAGTAGTAGTTLVAGRGGASAGAGADAMPVKRGSAGIDAVATGGDAAAPYTAGTGAMPEPGNTAPPMVDPATGASCSQGYAMVAGQCVCDLNGTFGLHAHIRVKLASMAPLEALEDSIELWGIVRQKYDAQGNLETTLAMCGQTTPDICVAAQAPILPTAEAYAQYIPVEAWDRPMTPPSSRVSFVAPLPGAAFATPPLVQLFGIALENPLGSWPTTRKAVDGGADFDGSATNGARWVDTDGDGKLGITVKVVGPGGATATATSGPPRSYGGTSSACPRSDARAARSPYAYLPLPQGLGVRRVKGLYSAQRSIVELHGTLDSCDRISGKLTGAKSGALKTDALIGGCVTVNGSGESACTAAMLDAAESGGGGATSVGLEQGSGEFVLARVQPDASCAQVRALDLK